LPAYFILSVWNILIRAFKGHTIGDYVEAERASISDLILKNDAFMIEASSTSVKRASSTSVKRARIVFRPKTLG
jgi:hypothetical protein